MSRREHPKSQCFRHCALGACTFEICGQCGETFERSLLEAAIKMRARREKRGKKDAQA